jgi:hypothetical protein
MLPHWDYYLALEEDLAKCARYVAPEEDNFDTYSIAFAKILLQTGSEVELVAKELCKKINPEITNRKLKNMGINNFYPIITVKYPKFKDNVLSIPNFNMKDVKPWLCWEEKCPPAWWTAYNAAKHHRGNKFSLTNFKNAIYSVAGLLIIIMYLWKIDFGDIDRRDDDEGAEPKLIMPYNFRRATSIILDNSLMD